MAMIIYSLICLLLAAPVGVAMPSGTVTYYSFDNTTGDGSGNGNDLDSKAGAVAYTNTGRFGGALYLDGITTLGTVSGAFPSGVPTGAAPYTVAAFIKADSGCGLNGGWIGYGTSNINSFANNFRLNSSNSMWEYWFNNDMGATLPSGKFFDGWHSVVGTWDGIIEKIYLDGVFAASRVPSAVPAIGTGSFVVGTCLNSGNFKGCVDELLILNRAVSAGDVAAYHAIGVAVNTPATPTGLEATGGDLKIRLNWTAALGWLCFNVKRSLVSGGPYTTIVTNLSATTYSDRSVNNGTQYYYVVSATNNVGESTNSAEVSAKPEASPSGVVAYYCFNNSVGDDSGNGNDLTITAGALAYTNIGRFGGALYLDGTSTLGTVSGLFPANVPTGAAPYTVAALIKADTGCPLTGGWIGYGLAGSNSAANNFRLASSNSVQEYWFFNDINTTLSSGNFFDGWHSVVGTWDGITETIYLDGVYSASRTPGTQPNIGATSFIVGKTLNDVMFKGWVDDLLIATTAFSAGDVAAYHNAGWTCSYTKLSPGGSGAIATNSIAGNAIVAENANYYWDYSSVNADMVQVAGQLTLPTNMTITVNTMATPLSMGEARLLFSCGSLAGNTNFKTWTTTAPGTPYIFKVELQSGTSVVIRRIGLGTVIAIR